ncbi:MAG: hypothetical protein U0Q16_26340 [Bryobacteraceae bacterium]
MRFRLARSLQPSIAAWAGCLALGYSLSAAELRIGSVPANSRMAVYFFEVEPETSRARLVVEFEPLMPESVPDQVTVEPPLHIQLPGLRFDSQRNHVIYQDAGAVTICAVSQSRRLFPRKPPSVRPTGACRVIPRNAAHAQDTGWNILRWKAVDLYFEAPVEDRKRDRQAISPSTPDHRAEAVR